MGVRRPTGLAMLAVLLALRIWDPAPLEDLRLRGIDFYQMIKPRIPLIKPVTIVDIDENSLKSLGQWPWPRTLVADLVSQLRRMGSVAIGFDIIFAEEDRLSPGMAVKSFRNVDEDVKAKLQGLPGNDEILAGVLRGARVVLGQSGTLTTGPNDPSLPQTGMASVGPDPGRFLVAYPGLLRNVPVLEKSAAGRGLLTIRNERDGIVRRVPLVVRAGGITAPALSLDMLRVVTNSGAVLIRSDVAGINSVAVPGLEIPTDRNGQLWIHFGRHDPGRYVSAKDILDGSADPDRIRGKLVLLGTSSVGLLDIKTTPLDATMPGVEIHAQILESILSKSLLAHPNWAIVAELGATTVIGAGIALLVPALGAVALLAITCAAAAGLIALAWMLFVNYGILFDLSFPLLACLLIYLTLVVLSYVREQKDRRRIRSAFGQYLSPTLVEQLAQSPEKLVLGGEEREMTFMFSDVRGFTTISESFKHDPQGLTQLMNRFLTPLTNSIIARRGTIDKYMGDAIMAFWNAPLDDPGHEFHACQAALDMLRNIAELNRVREEEAQRSGAAFIPIHIGIGINTGRCVVGNMGSDLRFDYSVLGDAVNLASRLEGRSKSYGAPIIVGSKTAEKALGRFALLELDLIRVKGKTEPERIFTILGAEEVLASGEFERLRQVNTRMLAAYRRRDWDAALADLQDCQMAGARFGLGEVHNLYLARIRAFQDTPPPDGWDGVIDLDTK
jgi:adenylate cyclase